MSSKRIIPIADAVEACRASTALPRDELAEPCRSPTAACRSPVALFADSRSPCAASLAADTLSDTPPRISDAALDTAFAEDRAASAEQHKAFRDCLA